MDNRSLKRQIFHTELKTNKEIAHSIKHSFVHILNKGLAQEGKIAILPMGQASLKQCLRKSNKNLQKFKIQEKQNCHKTGLY